MDRKIKLILNSSLMFYHKNLKLQYTLLFRIPVFSTSDDRKKFQNDVDGYVSLFQWESVC